VCFCNFIYFLLDVPVNHLSISLISFNTIEVLQHFFSSEFSEINLNSRRGAIEGFVINNRYLKSTTKVPELSLLRASESVRWYQVHKIWKTNCLLSYLKLEPMITGWVRLLINCSFAAVQLTDWLLPNLNQLSKVLDPCNIQLKLVIQELQEL